MSNFYSPPNLIKNHYLKLYTPALPVRQSSKIDHESVPARLCLKLPILSSRYILATRFKYFNIPGQIKSYFQSFNSGWVNHKNYWKVGWPTQDPDLIHRMFLYKNKQKNVKKIKIPSQDGIQDPNPQWILGTAKSISKLYKNYILNS